MMSLNPSELIKQYERMRSDHQYWEPIWQDLADYISPRRSQFTTKRSPGQKQTEKLFDSTALNACDRLAATINGTLTSRAVKWFSLRLRNEDLNEIKEVDAWLEKCAMGMFRAFNQSNFAQEMAEDYSDIVGLGTSAIFMEERNAEGPAFGGFRFTALSLSDYAIEENADGEVDTVFRTFQLSAAACIRRWGKEHVGEKILKAFNDGKPETMFTILHAVLPREPRMVKLGGPATKMPFASAHVCMADKYLINESGFQEFPILVARWSKTSGEKYGRGPGFLALPDIKTLNKIKEKVLRAVAKGVDPPTKTLREMVGAIRNVGGGNTVVRGDMDNIQPLFQAGYFDGILRNDQIKSSELIQSIEKMFMADQIQLPPPVANTTAYEIGKRFEQAQRILGPSMGRLESEKLQGIIRRGFGIMYRKGAFDAPPQVLLEQGAQIDVQYEGPLARSQRLTEAEGIEATANLAIQIAQVYPPAIDKIDWDKMIDIVADVRGAPAKVIRDEIEVKRIRAARAQQQQQQQQLADQSQQAEAMGKAAPALQILSGGQQRGK